MVSTYVRECTPIAKKQPPQCIWMPADQNSKQLCTLPRRWPPLRRGLIFSSPFFLCFLLLEISSSLAGVESSSLFDWPQTKHAPAWNFIDLGLVVVRV